MTTNLHRSTERGTASFGWLSANYSFSFANFFDANKIQFGMLRVLNDDTIAPGMGFGTHPHQNMEIITIPLEGALMHRDSMGNEGIIKFGEVQVMSAGTGIEHSEFNASTTETLKLLQLWVFPEKNGLIPRYDQKSFDIDSQINTFVTVVSPQNSTNRNSLWVHQQTYFNLGIFEENQTVNFKLTISGNGVYLFLIDGEIELNQNQLTSRDALEITNCTEFNIAIIQKSKILLVEVPMK
jgi:redox-sensitive bicupin YhaK (pirin superfamily)